MRRHAAECLRRAIAAGLTTSMDTGWDARGEWMRVLEPCLPGTGLLFVNEDEARMLTGASDFPAAARQLLAAGASTVVVKLAARGCAVFRGPRRAESAHDPKHPRPGVPDSLTGSRQIPEEESRFEVPGFDVPVVDTTGAGDCLVAGFLAALHHGAGLREAARFANAVAALSVTGLGAAQGLLGYAETLDWMASAAVRT
jgi:sugar/nucleoside kinase (ribokinase family)